MSWFQLKAILDDQRVAATSPPVACPNDGTPLVSGGGGLLVCPCDGWAWPPRRIITGDEVRRS